MTSARAFRHWMGAGMVAVLVVSVAAWLVTRERLPGEIRIATADPGGLYHKFAEALQPHLAEATDRPVVLVPTEGSGDNRRRLIEGETQLAILQSGAVPMDGIVSLAPLYNDVVLVVARSGRGIESIADLAGRNVAIGTPGSGMLKSAEEVLTHYRFAPEEFQQRHFYDLAHDETLDAAVVTTGFLNPDLERLLATGRFALLPIRDAEAFCLRHPGYRPLTVPRGLYGERPPLPPEPVPTVATTAILAAGSGVSELLVEHVVASLYENNLRADVPTFIPAERATDWRTLPVHPAARRYFDPYEEFGVLAALIESIAATKELVVALFAGLYLIWQRWHLARRREREREVQVMKDRLDAMLQETARIERAQMDTLEPARLKEYLDQVTTIKLRALDELAHEDLRGDRMFLIFLIQCGNLIHKIQAKIQMQPRPELDPR